MSDIDVLAFPDATIPLSGSEYVLLVQNGITCKARLNTITILAAYVKTALPPVTTPGMLIYVTNDVGGAVPAFSDGIAWRRVTDRAVIS